MMGKLLTGGLPAPVDSVDKTNVKKMRAGADWTERAAAIKGEMKTNGLMIGRGDGTQMRGW